MVSALQSALEKAEGYLDLSMLDQAALELENLCDEDRAHIDVWRLRCRIYQEAGQWEAVRDVAKHLVSLAPEVLEYWLWTAEATQRVLNVLSATRMLEMALRYHPEHPLIHYQLGVYACGERELEIAKVHLKTAFAGDESLKAKALKDPNLKMVW